MSYSCPVADHSLLDVCTRRACSCYPRKNIKGAAVSVTQAVRLGGIWYIWSHWSPFLKLLSKNSACKINGVFENEILKWSFYPRFLCKFDKTHFMKSRTFKGYVKYDSNAIRLTWTAHPQNSLDTKDTTCITYWVLSIKIKIKFNQIKIKFKISNYHR